MKKPKLPPIDEWELELRSAADLGRRGRYSGAPSWVRDQTELLRDIATILGSIAGKLDALPPEPAQVLAQRLVTQSDLRNMKGGFHSASV